MMNEKMRDDEKQRVRSTSGDRMERSEIQSKLRTPPPAPN